MDKNLSKKSLLNAAVIVAALGYFVDIYDLLLFSIVRVESLKSIGFGGRELEVGATLSNIQMTGLMLGGILWGVLGDKKGRLSVLFGSIFLYSFANFLNGYAQTFTEYAFCRFFAGLGLAGELGAGITLVAEVLHPSLRGYGTMIVATVGVSGAVVGGWVAQVFDWRTAFKIGGALGFALLLLRIGVSESGIFEQTQKSHVRRGSFLSLFTDQDRFRRFTLSILIGVPIWLTIGILVAYSPEFSTQFGITGEVLSARAVMACYAGFVVGDLGFGLFSQWMKSRNRAVFWAIVLNFLMTLGYLLGARGASSDAIYVLCFLLGATGGYWAVVCTIAAEQFGTNLRATVATAVPNFIRFSLVPMNTAVLLLKDQIGLVGGALVVSVAVVAIALLSLRGLKESFGKDLDFVEPI
jgi:putative MFS transporter